MNWDDFSYLLAVLRGRSLLQAARIKGVDKSTVARRLVALETALGVTLTERLRNGQITLTEEGLRVARHAEAMEGDVRRAAKVVGGEKSGISGRVRLTAVPLIANNVLLPRIPDLLTAHPDLLIELVADARDLNLAEYDADVALRLARPRGGGASVIAQKLGVLDFGCYVRTDCPPNSKWIGYDQRMQFLEQAVEISSLAQKSGALSALAVNDAGTMLQAVLEGLGKSLLPRAVARKHANLVEIDMPEATLPKREIWLMVRRDIRNLGRVEAVVSWLKDTLQRTL